MTLSCANCGAMLMAGATLCPVCRQPVAPTQGGDQWPQPPAAQTNPVWQQPVNQSPYGPPPQGISSNSGLKVVVWAVAIVLVLLLMVGGMGFAFYLSKSKRSPGADDETINSHARVTPSPSVSGDDSTMPPPPEPKPRTTNGSRAPISGGVLNGKAISLPKPAYPAIARAAHASGTVTVQVTIDESGKVTSARAVSGHPLLQASAVQAAYQARFSPTQLSGQPVKVTGVLTYNFVAE